MNNTRKNKAPKKSRRNRKSAGAFRAREPVSTLTLRDTVPDSVYVPMKYYDDFDQSGSIVNDEVINLNSIFDPDRSGVGHQPAGYDQWALFYNRYRVDCVDLQIDYVSLSTTQCTDVMCHANNDAAAITTNAQFLAAGESPYTWTKLLSTSGGQNVFRMRKRIHLNQVTGIEPIKYKTDDIYSAQFGSNPSEIIVAHITGKDFAFAGNITLKTRVCVTYYCFLFDRLQLTISLTKHVAVKAMLDNTDDDEKEEPVIVPQPLKRSETNKSTQRLALR
jgi:hypothetical protein